MTHNQQAHGERPLRPGVGLIEEQQACLARVLDVLQVQELLVESLARRVDALENGEAG